MNTVLRYARLSPHCGTLRNRTTINFKPIIAHPFKGSSGKFNTLPSIRHCTTQSESNERTTPKATSWLTAPNIALSLCGGICLGLVLHSRYKEQHATLLPNKFAIDINLTPPSEVVIDSPPKTFWERVQVWLRVLQLAFIFSPVVFTAPVLLLLPYTNSDMLLKGWWHLLRYSFEAAGACWIKFGQWASTRPDLFPPQMCYNLAELHSQCPAHSPEHSAKIVEKEFGAPLPELFAYFSKEAIASGAIAQIHKAVTHNGNVVAVKVLHPEVEDSIHKDFTIIYNVVNLVSKIPSLKWLSLPEAVLEFGKSMALQLDLHREAYNLSRFRHNFKSNPYIVFPDPLQATKSVLVETFEPGTPVSQYLGTESDVNRRLAKLGLQAYMKMMLEDNFTHSDLHPGNVLVRFDETGQPMLVLLDVGLVTELKPRDKRNFMALFGCVVRGNGEEGAELMVKHSTESQCTPEQLADFKIKMGKLFEEVQNKKLSEVKVGELINQVLSLVRQYHIKMESNFTTLVMGTAVLEGLGKQLNPNLDLLKAAAPYFVKQKSKQWWEQIKGLWQKNEVDEE